MTVPLEDRRTGSPAEQLRRDLARFRAAGREFESAWRVAFDRIKWPHDTIHRVQWKAILEADRHAWREAYEFVAPSRQRAAAGSLLGLAA